MRSILHMLAARHAAIAVLASVTVVLAGFAVWAAATSAHAVNRVGQLTTVSDAFQSARYAVAAENLAVRRYQTEPNHQNIQRYRQAGRALGSALATVERLGSPADRATVAAVRRRNGAATRWFGKLPGYVNRNDIVSVVAISDTRLQPMFDSMTATLNRGGRAHHQSALAALGRSRASQRVIMAATAITIALGVLLLASASATLRLRDRLEDARQREVERLKRAALADNLTGLGNHRAFEEDLERGLAGATDSGDPLSLVLLDLDGLKQTNDRLGHQAGDESIRGLAHVLADAGGETSAYRIGGDEFALLVPGQRAMHALGLVQHLQSQLSGMERAVSVGATGGVAEWDARMHRDELIRRADLALITAKRTRRRCLLYNDSLEPAPTDQLAEQHHIDVLATALARAVDAKDAYTHSHCETVSELCGLIAQELGMRPRDIARLRLAGLLHDVGKIGITDSILQKPGPLTDAEFEVMKTHSRLGHAIVAAAERPVEAEWILHHHERMDGCGYPDGLRGEEIPLESRVILVADAFEAITADRPYRLHQAADAALAELERHAGTHFDPACVAALARVVRPHSEQPKAA
jgi:diguanylate cyclase (GGDEF)-like protein